MADSHTGSLCTEIVYTHFGPLTSKVASTLLTRGRLPLPQLVLFTNLKPRIVRASLIVLIQHNIVWHVQNQGEPEMFEVNVDECLMRLRYGRYILQADQLFGKAAADIVQIILDHGKLLPPQIFTLLQISDSKALSVYNQALRKLVSGSYLRASAPLSHVSPKDRLIQYEIEEKNKIVGFPTAKQLREAKEVAEARLKREDDEAEKVGLKRKAKDQPGHRASKKKVVEEETVVDEEVYFRINCERFNVHIRNWLILTAAKERFNPQTATVLAAALKATEKGQLVLSDIRTEPISVSNVVLQLSETEDLSAGLAYSSRKVSQATCVKDYLGMLSSADNPTPAGKAGSFISLGGSKVQVEFEVIARRLRRHILESVTREKHGPEGVRILRLLLDTGKMDEKQISKIVLMAAKDVRPLLAAMSADSLISTQEVPKSADRNPTRTFYLWYVDLYKAYAAILGSAFKTLHNISARRRADREVGEIKAVLDKCARTDVQQDESLLTRMEREILKDWREREQKLTVLEGRVEELDLPYGNVLIHAGDLSSWGYPDQVKKVFDWIGQQAHPVKLVVAGNHDLSLDTSIPASVFEHETPESLQNIRDYVRSAEMKDAGVRYLEHEAVHFEAGGRTWKAYGSPAAPHYARGAFQYDDEETAMEIYDKMPLDTDILLTHTPPHGILDLTKKGKNAGCQYLQARLGSLKACKLHVFGHIHEAFGAALVEVEGRSRIAVNAAQSSRASRPIIVDIRFYPPEMLVELNKSTYASRVKRIYEAWNNASKNEDYSSIADVDALFLVAGDPASEDEPMRKGTCFQQWLLGYEFPSTFFLFQKDRIAVLCSASKSKILSQIQNVPGIPALEIYAQAKGKDAANDALPNFLSLYKSVKRAGSLLKETHTGKLVSEWQKLVAESDPKPEMVEIGPAVSSLMAVKDADELKLVQTAATLTSTLLKHHVAPKLESILDRESKISHEMLSVQIEARLGSGEGDNAKGPDMKVWGKAKGLDNIDWQSAEFCYPPIIISKSSKTGYDLRYTIDSTEDNIAHKGVLLVSFGLRYKSYSTNIGRTFIVDPNPAQEAQYNLLLSLQAELLSFIKDGAQARDVYQHAISFIKEKKPELEKHFVKTVGFGMGMEFRDATYVLSPKNPRVLKANMTFNLGLGFSDLTDSNGQKYALHLVDTIRIDTNKAVLLTDGVKHSKETLFFLDSASGEDDVKPKKPPARPKVNGSPSKAKTVGGKVLRNPRRAAQDEVHQTASTRLMEHQKEIHQRLQEDGIARFSEGGGGIAGKEGKSWKKFHSYKGEGALPDEVEKLRIFVDRKAQTVILPIHGFAVPFHINAIKNASKNDEGDFTYLRINFQTPGQLAGKKEDTPFEDADATFIRSVSYRSPDGHRFDSLVKQITDLKKEANKREQQKKEMADVIEQGTLIELKGRRPYKMQEAFIRPALDGKRLPGEVEIHQNDVLFSNVKHLFFQPCDHELLVIVHMHLKAPIMIGKKKTFDVQFFREATDVQFDETGNRKRKHRYGDEDEIEMEQQERKRRAMLNKEVKAFAEKVAEAASNSLGETLELDIPFRELSFEGVPFRTSVRLQPTTECLVHLTDTPFLVITLADIEIASLERVQYGLKQFDLVLIFKDFTKAPHHINSISSTQMDDVKNWLDSVDIPMSERPVNLNWGPLMKHINENPFEFFREGGWAFLGGAAGAEDSQSSSSGEESEFEVDGEDFASESSSDDDSDFDDGSGSDESGSDFGDGSESEGEDWDELERKAAKADLKRNEGRRDESDDDDRPKKKKAAPKGASKAAPKGKANGAKGKR